jgi:lipid-A-disaccharide synthase
VAGAAPRVLIVAGEVSGDHQGAALAGALRRLRPDLAVAAAGGAEMAAAGVDVLLQTTGWGVIGYVETYLRLPIFIARYWTLLRLVEQYRPDLLVLVDFPGMNRELVRYFAGRLPMIYFFPPQTYARRGRSAARLAAARIRLLAVLPFEADAYRRAGADVIYVGHPAVDAAAGTAAPVQALREEWGIAAGPMVGLMPGSRAQEIQSLLPPMLAAARDLRLTRGVDFVLPVPSGALLPDVQRIIAAEGVPVRVLMGRSMDVMRAADVVVVKTGTVPVEAACVGAPMVVVYRLGRLTEWIARRFVFDRSAYGGEFSIPNIILGRRAVPELYNESVSGPRISAEVGRLLSDPETRTRMRADLEEVRGRLGPPGVLDRAAQEALRVLDRGRGITLG